MKSLLAGLFVALAGPHGTTIWLAPSQVIGIVSAPGVGICPTEVATSEGVFFSCDSAAVVRQKLEAGASAKLH